MPVLHVFGLVLHAVFTLQTAQTPAALQTRPEPQAAPAVFWLPLTHTSAPVVHEVTPLKQVLRLVSHVVPLVQLTHVPALHTRPTPQPLPDGRSAPSRHWVVPELQEMTPSLQRLGLLVHCSPAEQTPQKPLLSHTRPAPHDPPALFGAPSTQVCAPVTHEVVPARQSPVLVEHTFPAAHEMHAPLPLQT